MKPLDVAIILGAGASYVHGAPLTKDLLPYFFEHIDTLDERRNVLAKFIHDVFHFDVSQITDENYPSIVDILSLVDIAIDKHENLSKDYDSKELVVVREALEYAIFRSLEHSLSSENPTRRRSSTSKDLLRKLKELDKSIAIISCNYDVIIDIAIARRDDTHFDFKKANMRAFESSGLPIDYGIEFANIPRDIQLDRNSQDIVELYKIHGSFNWLLSKVTGNIYFGGLNKAIGLLYDLDSYYNRLETQFNGEKISDLQPILITPTHLKDLRNSYIASVWRKAEDALRRAKQLIFIGYSMPADDIYIKYLVKRAMETSEAPKDIVVVDYPKKRSGRTEVETNYKLTLGANINYYRDGFAKFVKEEI